jgi:cysteine desulfurase / selenocysteine lyase
MPNVAGAVALAAAAAFIDRAGRGRSDTHASALRAHAEAGLAALPGVTVLSAGTGPSAIVSFAADGVHPHDIGTLLDEQGCRRRSKSEQCSVFGRRQPPQMCPHLRCAAVGRQDTS